MIGFSCTIMVSWEAILFVYQYGMYDGGPLGSILGYLFCWVGYMFVALCLAELTSMYPNAGGQVSCGTLVSGSDSSTTDPLSK